VTLINIRAETERLALIDWAGFNVSTNTV